MNAVIKTTTWGLTATAAAALMLSMNAFAQTAPPAGTPPAAAPPKAAPAAPAAPAKTLTEKAKDAVKGAKDAVTKKVDDTKKAAAAASACKGLDLTACGTKGAECQWVIPKKVDAKTGKADNPYCRKVAGVAKKAADKKVDAAAKPATAAAPAAPKPASTAPAAPKPAEPKKP
jgi:hypothetical protein